MFEIRCWFGRPINLTLLKTLANMEGWTGELVNRSLLLYLPDTSQTVFDIKKADTAWFCRLIAEHAYGSNLHKAIMDAVVNFVQPNYELPTDAQRDKQNWWIVLATFNGDKEKAAAAMVARELNKEG